MGKGVGTAHVEPPFSIGTRTGLLMGFIDGSKEGGVKRGE